MGTLLFYLLLAGSMKDRFTVAAAQFCVGGDKRENLAIADRLVREAAARGARFVGLPELFFWGGPRAAEVDAAESIPGPTTDALSALAAELGIYLVGGSILERVEGESKVYNTCVAFGPDGARVGFYRKVHLFDVDIGGQVTVRESDTRLSGDEVAVASCDVAPVGLAVCYDLRFPELFRRLTDEGVAIVCMPSAFTLATGAVHWEPLLRARAIENQVYMIAPNQSGKGASGIANYGNSMIVDPWGTVIARADDDESVICAEIDLEYWRRVRREIPCLEHRKLRG